MITRYITAEPAEAMLLAFLFLVGSIVLAVGIVACADWLCDKQVRRDIERGRKGRDV